LWPFLQSRSYRSQIWVIYREEDERERRHALHISGAPNVKLQALAGHADHAALHRLALSSPSFRDTLADWLGVAPSEPAA
jgi:hypothetical protein